MSQQNLFPDPQALYSKVIMRRRDFETLFEGFERLKTVSYVVSPDLLLEFFDRGYKELEVVVGENLSEHYRQDLAQKGADVTQRLAERMANGELKIYVPDRTLHTKLYMLERPGQCRVILTSANLTETARSAARQVNYAWYADVPPGHPWLARIEEDYKTHRDRCDLFMGDLAELLRQGRVEKRRELVETWLKSVPPEEVAAETRKLLQEISRRAIQMGPEAAEPVFSVRLPEAPGARREAERLLAPLNPVTSGAEIRLNGSGYLRYVQAAHGVPLMDADLARREVRLGLDGSIRILTCPLPEDTGAVAGALKHLESYFDTVDSGQAPDPRFAKTSMFEALLYLLASPFANEYMAAKRRRYGAIDSRGPRFLYIYGPSQNGKSTFLRFALRLLTGRSVEPLNGGDFSKRKILGAASVGTVFPLVFDDLVLTQRYPLFEEVLKSYWEVWWSDGSASPQLILSSNAYSLRDWAKSRVKRLDFDVQFAPDSSSKETLAKIFKVESPLFSWFSHLYFQRLNRPEPGPDDELAVARAVIEEIYRHAGRPLPDYFPKEPIERLYDPGRREWRDLLDRLRKARVEWDSDRASIHFSDDMQHFEIKAYENSLPAALKHRRRGRTLIIETPKEFRSWLERDRRPPRGWWDRLLQLSARKGYR
ncbi:MAG: phospholipase D family protein [Elusimicrobia bacterium]|nr:phospholipase D family protein [Elusimicrobiota bacterium]